MTENLPVVDRPRLTQVITSLLENDLYKFSMGQAIYHMFPGYETTWTFRCRNEDVRFTPGMVREIATQIRLYCSLRFTEEELAYLEGIRWIKKSYVDFLRLWRPNFDDFTIGTDAPCGLAIETNGTWLNTSMYEIPVLAIVNEVYFRMAYESADGTGKTFDGLMDDFEYRLDAKFDEVASGRLAVGTFSEFGLRRRLCAQAQDMAVEKFAGLAARNPSCPTTFIGTSNVFLAMKHGLVPVGTMAHEWIMCAGQGDRRHNPAYSNWYALDAWIKEYGVLNGIALTDTITTDCFLRDFQLTYATLFSGIRHDSGDPIAWGEKMLAHYGKLGIDPKGKTLLFSDSLDFRKADKICRHFQGRCKPAFGIGTYLSNDTSVKPLNIVMKTTVCNGQPVAKISDVPGKGMCKDQSYVNYLNRSIEWRMLHDD